MFQFYEYKIHEKLFLHVVSSMEDLGRRFPLISKIILNNIDDKSLTKFRNASRENSIFLDTEIFYWIRYIKKYTTNFKGRRSSKKLQLCSYRILLLMCLAFSKVFQQDMKYNGTLYSLELNVAHCYFVNML